MRHIRHGVKRDLLFSGGRNPFVEFDIDEITFTPAMDKRLSPVTAWDRAPIIQGWPDDRDTPDLVSFPQGDLLGNQVQAKYANFDPYQGTAVVSITPEWDGDDGETHYFLQTDNGAPVRLYKNSGGDDLVFALDGADSFEAMTVDVSGWVAGTTYHVGVSWSFYKPIDGTNYGRVTVNNVHTYGITTCPGEPDNFSSVYVGSYNGTADPANAILTGFTIYDRVLTASDGTGTDIGTTPGSDELTEIYNGGAPLDPTEVTGSRNVVFCLSTNQTDESLQTTGEAHSYPVLGELDDGGCDKGEALDSRYAVGFNGVATRVECGSDASIDDIPSGGHISVRCYARTISSGEEQRLVNKSHHVGARGWIFNITATGTVRFVVFCATTLSLAISTQTVNDGKFHELIGYYNDTTKVTYVCVDGNWTTGSTGVGAYSVDAAEPLKFGVRSDSMSFYLTGAIAFVELWSTDQFVAGTNRIPDRTCAVAGVGFVDSWPLEDQTSPTASTSGLNDGTITSGTWEALTQLYGTATVPPAIQFYSENDGIDFGSPAVLDDLFAADCTIECYMQVADTAGTTNIITKGDAAGTTGWRLQYLASGYLAFSAVFGGTSLIINYTIDLWNVWHHVAIDWDVGTLTGRLFIDGVYRGTHTAVGAYTSDAASLLIVNGVQSVGVGERNFTMGPIRISDNRRYTGTAFVPPDRANWPADDGNTCLLIAMSDGAGATVTDGAATLGPNNGTITFGTNTRWLNTTDLATIERGACIYQNGYGNIGAIAVGDGIVTRLNNTDDVDIAPQFTFAPGEDGRGLWQIELYDVTGTASLMTFTSPSMNGTATGGTANTLIDTGARWPQSMIGCHVYNITQATDALVTAVSGDGQTLTATGINGNAADEYYLHWDDGNYRHPWAESFVKYLAAGETPIDIRIKSLDGEGTLRVHRMEVPYSAMLHGDHESLTGGNPDLITGMTNADLDAGDTESSAGSAGIIHSGSEALEWNVGAATEGMYVSVAGVGDGTYFTHGAWGYGDGGVELYLSPSGANALLQHSSTLRALYLNAAATWRHNSAVFRSLAANPTFFLMAAPGASGDRFSDDMYLIAHNPVTLTVTPMSQANSTVGSTLLVNGRDLAAQAILAGRVSANYGDIRFTYTPNHGDADVLKFGSATPYICYVRGDGNNLIIVNWSAAANTIRLRVDANGVTRTDTWDTGGVYFVPGVPHQLRVVWTASHTRLYVDGVLRATVVGPTNFSTVPNTLYWASNQGSSYHDDAQFGPY